MRAKGPRPKARSARGEVSPIGSTRRRPWTPVATVAWPPIDPDDIRRPGGAVTETGRSIGSMLRSQLGSLFNLAGDQAEPAAIDTTIRSGVEFRGTNLWLLIFAVAIASVGLNMNSAAVIIGAMLVSPLMGPIMAVGYGAAVNDFALIRSAAKNLGMAVAFSVAVSTLYFVLTPLSEARSEILSRTSPAIWDVLIALFGGLAGIVGVTRREKSNVIPGVAIATALMPPLCTAGYGIATLQPSYALGALYLFSINSVFIATATLLMVRVMGLPEVAAVDHRAQTRARRMIAFVVVVTAVPSLWLAAGLVRQEVFVSRARAFLTTAFPREHGTYVVATDLDAANRAIRVTVVGEPVSADRQVALEGTLAASGLSGTSLEVAQARREEVDVASLRAQVAGDLQRNTLMALDEKTRTIDELQERLDAAEDARAMLADVVAELRASHPEATDIAVGSGTEWTGEAERSTMIVTLALPAPLPPEEVARLEAWLQVRAKVERVRLVVSSPEPPPKKGR